jgi:hypothetical protein
MEIGTLFQPQALVNLNFLADANSTSITSQCHILLDKGGNHWEQKIKFTGGKTMSGFHMRNVVFG